MSTTERRVIVIGGGVIGTASAYYLSKSGWNVTILDRAEFGNGSSHGNCGLICPSHVLPLAEPGAVGGVLKSLFEKNSPFRVKPRFDPALWSWFLHFARRCNANDMMTAARGIQPLLESSLALYQEIIDQETLDCEWETRGLLHVYRSRSELEKFTATADLLRDAFQCPARRLDGEELLDFEPALKPGLAGGWYYDHDAHLRPDRLLRSWRRVLEARGVTIQEHCEVLGFGQDANRTQTLQTNQGELVADAFVAALGALTPTLSRALGCRIPIQPGKGYSITMPRPSICPNLPLIFPETRVAVTPFRSGYRIGSTMEFAGYDTSLRPERLEILKAGARPYLQEPYREPFEEQWFGWRPMTYDSLPIIDRAPAWNNVLIAAGHNMLGLSMAPATGKLVSELLNGDRPHLDPAPYRVSRF